MFRSVTTNVKKMKAGNLLAATLIALFFNFTLLKGSSSTVYISDKVKKQDLLTLDESNRIIQQDLDKFYSNKRLGSYVENGRTFFGLFAPTARKVVLVTFDSPEAHTGNEYEMKRDSNGVWETSLEGELWGLFYGYKIAGRTDKTLKNKPLCVDPYAKAVATFTTHMNPRKAIVVKENNYDWQGDKWIERDWRDLIIYEMHVRDMTAHPSSGATHRGTYQGLIEQGTPGGINYIKSLGVNTIELLPSQEYGNAEIPFQKHFAARYNTWNPYERNHWGYMTSNFFAPAAYYSMDWQEYKWNTWMGKEAKQINDFKDMVKAFHKEGIAVMMDVVYNHLSEYEIGNLKEIDAEYYFRLDDKGNFRAESGCGNDLKTERPMTKRLIIESLIYWMKEYHIDGFRFDLAKLIDWESVEDIIYELKKVNPNVVIVGEPWGGGYDPQGFSLRGWGSWNDQIRNGIKGENPFNGHGWIFGKWYGNNDTGRIQSYVNGTLERDRFGLFQRKEHSVNYLESHDGYTLGDFIRIATGEADTSKVITNTDAHTKLSENQLRLNKLAALFLFTSQGITMISEGQEFARSKVIPADINVKDPHKGKMDHNTYNKDNEVNYLNYNHAEINKDLVEYYRGLISLRNRYAAFRRADYSQISFIEGHNPFSLGYTINFEGEKFAVFFNADNNTSAKFNLPEGSWNVLVNASKAGIAPLSSASGSITLKPKEGVVLRLQR